MPMAPIVISILLLCTAVYHGGASIAYHNSSDCCCENLPFRQLVGSPEECAASCSANSACHAALYDEGSQGRAQCKSQGPAGKIACCLHKGHFDTMHPVGNSASHRTVVIDMGTTNYTSHCPVKPPSPPSPPPGPGPAPFPAESVRPLYHYTRATGEMNDPNGLMWLYGADGVTPEYHMFHQHAAVCINDSPLKHTGTHVWGHGVSSDLVHWKRMNDSGVCGSTSGGVALGSELREKTGWDAAILVSAPSMASIGADSVGLHLYTSNASHLETWQQYIPHPLPSNGDPCVICPSIVPDWTYASNIGDTYVWSSPPANEAVQPGSNRTIYVLSGSSACGPNDNGGHWCGYGKGTPQMLLFSSTNLVDWKFVNVFWKGGSTADPNGQSPGSGSMYTPDTFRLADGRQALIRLAGKTVYNLGQFNEQKGTFLDLDDGALHTESNGAFHCGQSMTDAKGRRVQFGWLGLHLQGAPYSGAQSLPRLITAAPPDLNLGPDKLLFAPLPELAYLHDNASHITRNMTLNTTSYTMLAGLGQATALHHHLHVAATLSTAVDASMTVCVQCDATGANGVAATVQLSVINSKPQFSCMLGNGAKLPLGISDAALSRGYVDVVLDIFTDGAVVEMFANNGEQVGEQGRSSVSNAGVGFAAAGGVGGGDGLGGRSLRLAFDLWKMQQSVE